MLKILEINGQNEKESSKEFYLLTWEYLYKNLVYLTVSEKGTEINSIYVENFIGTFFRLPGVVQEYVYPRIQETMQMLGVSYPKLSTDGLDEINITGNLIIGLVKSVLLHNKGTKDENLIKRVYAIVDGWLVKLITAFPKELGGVDLTQYRS